METCTYCSARAGIVVNGIRYCAYHNANRPSGTLSPDTARELIRTLEDWKELLDKVSAVIKSAKGEMG